MDSKRCFKRWGAGTVIINSHFSTHLNYLWQVIPTHYIPFHLDSNLHVLLFFSHFIRIPVSLFIFLLVCPISLGILDLCSFLSSLAHKVISCRKWLLADDSSYYFFLILIPKLQTCVSRGPLAVATWKSNGNFKLNVSETELLNIFPEHILPLALYIFLKKHNLLIAQGKTKNKNLLIIPLFLSPNIQYTRKPQMPPRHPLCLGPSWSLIWNSAPQQCISELGGNIYVVCCSHFNKQQKRKHWRTKMAAQVDTLRIYSHPVLKCTTVEQNSR